MLNQLWADLLKARREAGEQEVQDGDPQELAGTEVGDEQAEDEQVSQPE